MLASKLLIPRAFIALAVAVVLIILFARAFCAWACPVPLLQRLRGLFSRKPKPQASEAEPGKGGELARAEGGCDGKSCSSCAERRAKLDSRHFILGGSLLSAAIFGFPVFCLVCPIGLSFATVLLVIRMFSGGDMTWSIIIVPLILVVEILVFKKWCGKICPLGALMSLIGMANKTFRPHINKKKCLECGDGKTCGVCASVCPEGIDPRKPAAENVWSECTKCRECVHACPTKAITMPFLPKRSLEASQAKPETDQGKSDA
jgi:ferredoxin-type protein NapH